MKKELRDFQLKVVKKCINSNADILISAPTGCGKTIVFAKIAEDSVRHGDRVLILAHRGELGGRELRVKFDPSCDTLDWKLVFGD